MNIYSIARAASILALVGALVMSIPGAEGHPCYKKHKPGSHCDPEPPPSGNPDRIPGCVIFNSGYPVDGDGEGTYCDGNTTTAGSDTSNTTMQVAMGCKDNWFNFLPGGGERRINVNFASPGLQAGIESCREHEDEDVVIPITISGTSDALMNVYDCSTPNPDWAFLHHMRAQPSDGQNVCDLDTGESLQATMRFQSHLYHLKTCKGGSKKCGQHMEVININYDGDSCSDNVVIACNGDDGNGQCDTWTVASNGTNACIDHSSGGAPETQALPFSITFTAD